MGDRSHPNSVAVPPLPRGGEVAAADRDDDGEDFDAGASRGSGERAARSVSPEEFRMGSSSSSSSSSGNDGRWDEDGALVAGVIQSSTAGLETTTKTTSPSFDCVTTDITRYVRTSGTIHPTLCRIESSAAFGCTINDNEVGDNDGYCDAPSTSGDVPFIPSAGGDDPQSNEIIECDSVLGMNRSDGDESKMVKHPHGRDSPPFVGVTFRDIIGHGQAKLRLDEALLPLALPHEIAESVLTGA